MFSLHSHPLSRYWTIFYLLNFPDFLFIFGWFLTDLFQWNTSTTAVVLFFCHFNHLLSN